MKKTFIAFLLVLLLPTDAGASDDNILISNLYKEGESDYYWNVTSSADRQRLFNTISRDLALAIGNKGVMPAETLGVNGFEIGLDTTITYVGTAERCSVESQITACQHEYDRLDAWRVMDADHRLTFGNALVLPTLRLRKGLPFSTEAGLDLTYLSFSHQGALTGYGRVALHEGMWDRNWHVIPDVAVTLSGSRFLGNEELAVSMFEWATSFGWTFPVGGIRDSHLGTISPFLGTGVAFVTAVPKGPLPDKLEELEGRTGLRGKEVLEPEGGERKVVMDSLFRPWKVNVGTRITSGIYQMYVVFATAYNPVVEKFDGASVTVGMGFIY